MNKTLEPHKPGIFPNRKDPNFTFYVAAIIIASILVLSALTGCKKVNEGEARDIVVTWNDTINYRSYLGTLQHCRTPMNFFNVTVASGQDFKFVVTNADSGCVSSNREYDVWVHQGKKLIYHKFGYSHDIKIAIK